MAILAGIDEAGYGPLLGPMVCSVTVFEAPSQGCDKGLWNVLASSVSPKPGKGSARLAVADSKRLFSGANGLGRLERTALAFLRLSDQKASQLGQLLASLGSDAHRQMEEYPWYRKQNLALPLAADANELTTCANALHLDTGRNEVHFRGVRSEVLLVGEYNDLVDKTRNKSAALFGLVAKHIDRLVRAYAGLDLRIYVDKLGGRQRYQPVLQRYLPGWSLRILEETPQASSYEMQNDGCSWQIHFQAKGESRHLPVALASIYSKYVRELLMELFNRYWCEQITGLRPTAGYYTDGRRFLKDIASHCKKLNIPMHRLLRNR